MGQCCSKIYGVLCSEYRSEIGETWVKANSQNGTLYGNDQLPDKVQEGFQWTAEIISAFHFMIAIGILIFGVYTYSLRNEIYNGNQRLSDDAVVYQLSLVPNYLIGIGCIVAAVSLVGAASVMRHHVPLMATYIILLFLYSVAQLICAVMALTLWTRMNTAIHNYFSGQGIINYRMDTDLTSLIDFLQMEFQCCGGSDVDGYLDWSKNIYFNCSDTNPSFERCNVPYSCCKKPVSELTGMADAFCGRNAQQAKVNALAGSYFYTDGCVKAIYDSITHYGGVLVAAILGLVIVPIVLEVILILLIRDVHEEQQGYLEWERAMMENDASAEVVKDEVDAKEIIIDTSETSI